MKKVCVVTVSRADYGLLRWVIQGIHDSPELELQLVVSGAHFVESQGKTVQEILDHGFPIAASVPIAPEQTKPVEINEALGRGLAELGRVFDELTPDVLVLLGDRSETMVAAVAATVAGIPIAHIHGGEVTLGAIDDAFRHSITKMSCLHFVAEEEYRSRVIQMGEEPGRVFVVGALGHESIRRLNLLSKEETEKALGISFGDHNLLVTVHPETINPENNECLISSIIETLRELPEAHVFITASNTDSQGDDFNRTLREFATKRANVWFFESLGTLKYLSVLSHVDAIVGNSSSGIHEAPCLGIPTVDIGNRQMGRSAAKTVVHCPATKGDILEALTKRGELRKNSKVRTSNESAKKYWASSHIVEVLLRKA